MMNRLTIEVLTRGDADEELIPEHIIDLDWFIINANRVSATGEKQLDYENIKMKWKIERGIKE
jgi:hypothetical protein